MCLQLMVLRVSLCQRVRNRGKVIRLKGKGLPDVNTGQRGDQLVQVNVWTPKSVNSEERASARKAPQYAQLRSEAWER